MPTPGAPVTLFGLISTVYVNRDECVNTSWDPDWQSLVDDGFMLVYDPPIACATASASLGNGQTDTVAGKVNKSGDTMTGPLKVTSSNPLAELIGVSPTGAAGSTFSVQANGTASWDDGSGAAFASLWWLAVRKLATDSGIQFYRPNTTENFLAGSIDTDVANRFAIRGDGRYELGSGATARDTFLYRLAAGVFKTDGNLARAGLNVVSADTTITPDRYLNVLTGTTARVFTLPAVTANTGIELVFKNRATAAVTMTIQRAGTDQIWTTATGLANSFTVAQNATARLINDGTYWLQVG